MKKLLSLILTLALLSTMFVFGATSASAAAATTTVTETYTNPDMIFVSTTTEGVQTVTNMTAEKNMNITSNASTPKRWAYVRFPVDDFESVSSVTFNLGFRCYNSGDVYVLPATEDDWTRASSLAAGAEEGKNVLTEANGDTLLECSTTQKLDAALISSKNSSGELKSATGTIVFDGTDKANVAQPVSGGNYIFNYDTYGGSLLSYVTNSAADSNYVYFAITFYSYSATTIRYSVLQPASTHSLIVTGERAIEGLGTKVVAEKTKTVYLDDEIAHLVNGTEGNQYNKAGTYQVNNCTYNGTHYEKYLYLKADLTEFADKNIESVILMYNGRIYKSGLNLYVSTTSSSWSADTITLENAPTSTSALILAEDKGYMSAAANLNADITSIVNLKTNAVLSLRFEVKSEVTDATHDNGVQISNVGNSSGNAPRLQITYLDEIDTSTETITSGTTFTFKGEVATTGAKAMLLVGIYDSTGALIDVVSSGVLTNGTDELEVDVDLSKYTTAASIKGFFWDGATLAPYMDPTSANVTAAV